MRRRLVDRGTGGNVSRQSGLSSHTIRTRCGPTTLHAESTLDTHFGSARSAWKRDGDRILLEVTVPPGATAKIVGPGPTNRLPPPR
ncbi:alpha-L-rhamnosidase C-terminal domain-containing protein [Nocardia noduli]|uniref:alpha-L-rhamnosidase C-terminal domain-containing protein n=1 Tax=Nocardia noduli TaxID=2815722 RepID=UPI0034D45B6A